MGRTLSKPDPTRTVEVICAGYSRTGTSSMQSALEKLLEGPVYHGGTHIWFGGNDAHVKAWGQACDAKYIKKDKQLTLKILRGILKGYTSALDIPPSLFIPELLELYPDAKVVLTTRDLDQWWKSFSLLLDSWPDSYAGDGKVLMLPAPAIRWILKIHRAFVIQGRELLGDGRGHHDFGPNFLQRYNESVINMVPKDRLLVFDVREGWEPLAKFLGKPVPEGPFPRINESAMLEKHVRAAMAHLLTIWAGLISTAAATTYIDWRFWKR